MKAHFIGANNPAVICQTFCIIRETRVMLRNGTGTEYIYRAAHQISQNLSPE